MWARRSLLAAAIPFAIPTYLRAAEPEAKGKLVAPPIDLLSVDGTAFSLQQLRGNVVLVNFWATWCEPCVTEMPSLQQLHDAFGASGFAVLTVNYQEGPARIVAFLQKMNLTLPVVRDTDGSVARAWGARVFPASYLIDRDGLVQFAISGAADWTSDRLVNTIRALLNPPPSR